MPSANAGDNAIEAPFVFRRGDDWFLFASIDYCCRGAQSTYKIILGRASSVTGPYLDRTGMPMAEGGGTLVAQGDARWHGVGHCAVETFDGGDYLIFHGYDAQDPKGRSKLRIERLRWDEEGWPVVDLGESSQPETR